MSWPKRNNTIRMLRFWRPFIHGVIIIASFLSMWLLRKVTDLIPFVQLRIPAIDMHELLLFAIIAAVIFVIIWAIFSLYELHRPIHAYYKKFLSTWWIWLMIICFVAYMWFWYLFVWWISRFVLLVWSIVVFLVITIIDTIYNKINSNLEHKNPYRVLVLWNDQVMVQWVVESLWSYKIYDLSLIGIDEYADEILHDFDVILTAWQLDSDRLQWVADRARIAGKLFFHASDTFFLEDLIAVPHRIWPLMAMEYIPSPLDWWWRVIKRLFDVVVSTISLIVLSPLLLLIAIIIKIDSKWPALYSHQRVWRNEKPFTFIKFRSMYTHMSVWDEYGWDEAWKLKKELMDSDLNIRKWELQKIENDPRVTKVGRFLRKTSLDELPNLFSVLQWSMSLVWPRPHEVFEVARYKSRQKRLFSVKPWITGYAQIFGRDALSFDEEAKLDLYYIQNRSVLMDIYVLVSTVKVILRGS